MSGADGPGPRSRRLGPVLRVLLRLYPAEFRARFGSSLEETLGTALQEARSSGPISGRVRSVGTVLGVLRAAAAERLRPSFDADRPGPLAAPLDALRTDVFFAVRSLLRRPRFAAGVCATLAVGIGSAVAVFTVLNGVLLRPLPYPEPDRLFMVWSHPELDPDRRGWMSLPDLDDAREVEGMQALEGWNGGSATLHVSGAPERVPVARVTGGFMELFDVRPALGRDVSRADAEAGAAPVVVISHGLWSGRLGGDTAAVGSTLAINEVDHRVVGVAPDGFGFPDETSLWIPLKHDLEGCDRGCAIYRAVARSTADVGGDVLDERLAVLAGALSRDYPASHTDKRFRTEGLLAYEVGDVRAGLWILLASVTLLLLIVCANLASLMLVRGSARAPEVALRSAIGASRVRLIGQIAMESVVLAGIGGVLGVALSQLLVGRFLSWAPAAVPRAESAVLDPTVLAVAVGTTLLATVAFGLAPAVRVVRRSWVSGLKSSTRGGLDRRASRTRGALVAAEVGVSLVLLFGAGLLVRSIQEMGRVDLGFTERSVVRFSLSLPTARYPDLEAISSFYERLEERIAALPGVESVGSIQGAPLAGGNVGGPVFVSGRPTPDPGSERFASVRPVTSGYMETLGLTILAGRGLGDADGLGAEPVAVVNERFAAEHFPDGSPIGSRIRVRAAYGYGSPEWLVVGVVADVRRSLAGEPIAELYVPHAHFGPAFMQVHVRGPERAEEVLPAIQSAISELEPAVAATDMGTIASAVRDQTARERFFLLLIGGFAVLAALLAAVGLYGTIAFAVQNRNREIGIRMALGADERTVLGMVLGWGVRYTVVGVGLGIVGVVIASRWFVGITFGVPAIDPLVLAAVTALVSTASLLAVTLPARSAARVDPNRTLKAE